VNLGLNIEEAKEIKGVFILTPQVSDDLRGNIWTSFIKQEVEKLIPESLEFNHDKFSLSKNNVLRGIHGDSKSWKLVTCVYGKIQQVVVDMREDSPTYLNWIDFEISRNNQQLVLIPPNMGNAYYVMSKEAVYHYKLAYHGSYIDADEQFSIKWDNEKININWSSDSPILSLRDSS
jgi:dTDP-4-dehydrorhamnose 3,5-epimerase